MWSEILPGLFRRTATIVLLSSMVSGGITYWAFQDIGEQLLTRVVTTAFSLHFLIAFPVSLALIYFNARFRLANRDLARREAEMRNFIEAIPDIVTRATPDAVLFYVNAPYARLTGIAADNLPGRSFLDFVDPDQTDIFKALIGDLTPEKPNGTIQLPHRLADGAVDWVLWTNFMVFDAQHLPMEIISIGRTITDLHNAQDEIERQAKELATANDELDQFTHVASHDLQEPMRKIRLFSELLVEAIDDNDREAVDKNMAVIVSAADRSRTLVRDLLTLSRTTHQATNLQPTDLRDIVNGALGDLSALIERADARVDVDLWDCWVSADHLMATQVFQNLIQNAVKYRSPGRKSRVSINISDRGQGRLVVAVEDNGVGFEPEFATTIFEPFKRLHARGVYEGTGIGLAIVAKAAASQGWLLKAESEPGKGACFLVDMPAADAHKAEDKKPPAAPSP